LGTVTAAPALTVSLSSNRPLRGCTRGLRFAARGLSLVLLPIALLVPTGFAEATTGEGGQPPAEAQPPPTAVALHEPELSAAQTVWCIANPNRFVTAARAVGLDVTKPDESSKIDRPGKKSLTLEEWSMSGESSDIHDFDVACLPAYEAFGPPASGGSGSGDDELLDWAKLIAAGLLGGALGLGGESVGERKQRHRQDAGLLQELSGQLSRSVSAFVSADENAQLRQSAREQALALQIAIARWQERCPTEVDAVDGRLKELLGALEAPSEELNTWTTEIGTNVDRVARSVRTFFRKG